MNPNHRTQPVSQIFFAPNGGPRKSKTDFAFDLFDVLIEFYVKIDINKATTRIFENQKIFELWKIGVCDRIFVTPEGFSYLSLSGLGAVVQGSRQKVSIFFWTLPWTTAPSSLRPNCKRTQKRLQELRNSQKYLTQPVVSVEV